MTATETPCLTKVRDTGSYPTYCGQEKGHDGDHVEIRTPGDRK